eukprot:TRINITY_DN16802_c0_g1_i1.p1 TRINITY_DN16802_c0_g1~~TRINITY_DN16802_c0_g1_i1.p1  ORF type:complete len:681 (+),score=58.62 TRINITY_DN16802_c0_g1_i1:77-2119(+)
MSKEEVVVVEEPRENEACEYELEEIAEGFWFGKWYPCKVVKIRGGGMVDVVWGDGTETRRIPVRNLRKVAEVVREPVDEADVPVHVEDDEGEKPPLAATILLPLGPAPLRYFAVVLAWAAAIFLLICMTKPPESYTEGFWAATIISLTAATFLTCSELGAAKQTKKLKKLSYQHADGKRVGRLLLLKEQTRARTRHAMNDIVNTLKEKAFNVLHNNELLSKTESCTKGCLSNNTADVILSGSESVIEWGSRWKRLNATMHDSHGDGLTVRFGVNMRKLYFYLEPGYLNGASYGATPKPVLEGQREWAVIAQRNPASWRFKALPLRLRQIEARLANMFSADPDDLTLLVNANAATSTILKSLPWQVGDRFFTFNVDYDATHLAAKFLERHYGVEHLIMDISLPVSDIDLCSQLHQFLKKIKDASEPLPNLANICHVTSKTAYVFPVKELTEIFHAYGVSVMVDGAQAAGQIEVNISTIGADWYYGTVHKWMYSCPGVGFLVTQPHKQRCTFPLTVSYFDGGGYNEEFSYQGLQDFSNWMSVVDGLDFVDEICGGWDNVRSYCHSQARACAELLSKMWRTTPLQPSPAHYASMPILPLPNGAAHTNARDPIKVMGYLSVKHGITAFALIAEINGTPTLCIRCTCQIYTDISDWETLGNAILSLQGDYSSLNVLKGMSPDLLT